MMIIVMVVVGIKSHEMKPEKLNLKHSGLDRKSIGDTIYLMKRRGSSVG
jgi:hypothetical protein